MSTIVTSLALLAAGAAAFGQTAIPTSEASPVFIVEAGTRIPLGLIDSVSSRNSLAGDRVYLETLFPIEVGGHVVIPPHSYVMGTVTQVTRPGRVKGRGELYIRFDSILLPNGVKREFRSTLGSIDASGKERLDRDEGRIEADSNKGHDAFVVGASAASGASLGAVIGSSADRAGLGAGAGAAGGAVGGIAGVLLTRGPEAVLAKGSTIEMVLDRTLRFAAAEVNFGH